MPMGSRKKIWSNVLFPFMLLVGTSNPLHTLRWVQCPCSFVSMQLEVLIFRIFLTWVVPGFANSKVLLELGRASLIPRVAASLVAALALASRCP